MRFHGKSDVGRVRSNNEDTFCIFDLPVLLAAVFDGMGGHAAGEVASYLAMQAVSWHLLNDPPLNPRLLAGRLVEALELGHALLLDQVQREPKYKGMGTTATVGVAANEQLLLGQVGDSRAYILRGGRLVQVTRDQSLVQQLVDTGQLTPQQACDFAYRNVILQALGIADKVDVAVTSVELRRGDRLLLCSDGLSEMVRDDALCMLLHQNPHPDGACAALIDAANRAGGSDNITAVVVVFDDVYLPPPTAADVHGLTYKKYAP